MKIISCNNIDKVYKKKQVLHDINLELEENKIYGLIGRNGAGKTTLLSILSAQNPATRGDVQVMDMPVWENQKALDYICFSRELTTATPFGVDNRKVKDLLFASSCYFPHWDNEYAERLIKEFELDKKKRLNRLSKGMLSMVSIVVALASKAQITFFDEPVAGLDVFMREKFYALLLEEYSNTGRTFVVSTHIIDEASSVFEEVIIIDEGRIITKANTEELLSDFVQISGKDEEVDRAAQGYEIVHSELVGRSKGVCISLNGADRSALQKFDVDLTPVTLQKAFVYLTEKEAR